MIDRYTKEEMKEIWTLEAKFRTYLQVELAVCKAWFELGKIGEEDFQNIINKADFQLERIDEIEKQVNHDVIAFLTNVNENIGPSSRFVHMGLTSSDVVDTALALQIKRANDIIAKALDEVIFLIRENAFKYKDVVCAGRSHGILAEPIVFGFKFLNWLDFFERSKKIFNFSRKDVEVGQISGPCGTYSNIDPEIEKKTCEILNLQSAKISTQVVSRDRYSTYLYSLTMISKAIETVVLEIRHLQRTEVLELEEGFGKMQKGSSAMPHKKNPISSENLTGLARIVKSNFIASLENIVLWHERDISHSSVERIILPDTTTVIHYMLSRFKETISNLQIHKNNMIRNLNLFGGIVFSQKVLLKLVEKGLSREEAYKIVQKNALENFNVENGNFKKAVLKDEKITSLLSGEQIEECFNINDYLKNIDKIYERF